MERRPHASAGRARGGARARPAPLPILCGADIELGNFIVGLDGAGTGYAASRALLREIEGFDGASSWRAAASGSTASGSSGYASYEGTAGRGGCGYATASSWGGSSSTSRDWGRKFLPENGGCIYIDLDHLELCIPEVLSAHDHVAAWHAMLRIARRALDRANAARLADRRIVVLVNNSDGWGASYGSHLDFLIDRRTFTNLFHRKLHYLLFLASYFASAIIITGGGKVGSENGRPAVPYQISQRADFAEILMGTETTFRRPIVNSRDEPLAGPDPRRDDRDLREGKARLHVIFLDSTLCPAANLLRVGATQIVLAMIAQDEVCPGLILDDPLRAVGIWSRDPDLRARARLLAGARSTALDWQRALLRRAKRFVADGRAQGIVPRADEIIELWEDTLERLRAGDVATLAGRLDWVLKRTLIGGALERRRLPWSSPEAKHLDHLYSSLDPDEGLFWCCERDGAVERVVPEARIRHFEGAPPDDTRAWLRAHILRLADPDDIVDVDWDEIRFRFRRDGSWWSSAYYTFSMADPLGFTRRTCEPVLRAARTLEEALRALDPDGTNCAAPAAAAERAGGGREIVRYEGDRGDRGGREGQGGDGNGTSRAHAR
ncbi:MAG: proteasome accessory factor PafA2 family protein [Planctomycetes bacterium]|nr:proteasome accessory factor PafA2 family protein [Planctomycetota bacterium]